MPELKLEYIEPLADRVLLERQVEEDGRTHGGIIVPDQVAREANMWKVIAIGDLVTRVKKGDMCMVTKYAGQEIGPNVYLAREPELVARLNFPILVTPDKT